MLQRPKALRGLVVPRLAQEQGTCSGVRAPEERRTSERLGPIEAAGINPRHHERSKDPARFADIYLSYAAKLTRASTSGRA